MTLTPCPIDFGWKKSAEWLQQFVRTCQAASEELEPNGVIDMGNRIEDIISMKTRGHVFVRQEFYDFYDRLKTSDASGRSGQVVCGSPGIGKSVFLLYALARRLKEKRTTLFYTRNGDLYLFHSDSVYLLDGLFVVDSHLYPLMAPEDLDEDAAGCRVWVLMNAGTPSGPPLTLTTASTLFPVHAAPPNRRHYHEWTKQSVDSSMLIMNPWKEEELHRMLALSTDLRVSQLNGEAVRQARTKFGPCARDIIRGIRWPTDLAAHISKAIQATRTIPELIRIATSACESENYESVPHRLFFIQRRFPSAIAEDIGPDDAVVEVKTVDIFERLLSEYDNITLAEAERFCRLCSPFPETSILAGWLFEKIAIKYLSGEASTSGVIQGMYLMEMMNTDASPNPSFVYSSSAEDTCQLHVAPWGVTLKMTTERPVESIHPTRHVEATLPISTRVVTPWNDLAAVSFESFYVPKIKNHPLFDAAFFSLSDDNQATLWILQMTTSARQSGSKNGYDIVRELRRKIKLPCVVKYVLVVPERPHERVIWNMPFGWQSDVAGPVYVQFLAMDKIFEPWQL